MSDQNDNARDRILRSASELFSEKGFDATGISDIGKRAGVAKSLFYHYFRSKEEVLEVLYQEFFAEATNLRESFMEKFRTQGPDAGQEFTRAYLAFLKERRDVIRIVMKENLKADRRFSILPFFQADFERGRASAERDGHPFPQGDHMLVSSFFFAFLPTLSFSLFQEEFAAFFGLDPEKLNDKYIQYFEASYVSLMKSIIPVPKA